MILFHAISSYQLLLVMILANRFKERCILILPDFIQKKYPQYKKIVEFGIFDEVYLFPYLYIEHNSDTISMNVKEKYEKNIPYDIDSFEYIFVGGAHFYFTDYLIKNKKRFIFIEDATGMLDRKEEMYLHLKNDFPVHAEFAKKNGLFDGNNEYVKAIMCAYIPQKRIAEKEYIIFNVQEKIYELKKNKRKKIINFFVDKKIKLKNNAALLLTQHFSNLGIMSQKKQEEIYRIFYDKYLKKYRYIYIKKHPDDQMDYLSIFQNVVILDSCFPAELLPYICRGKNESLYTISTTCFENLKQYFNYSFSLKEKYRGKLYVDDYNTIKSLLEE